MIEGGNLVSASELLQRVAVRYLTGRITAVKSSVKRGMGD